MQKKMIVERAVVDALGRVAPEVDIAMLDRGRLLRDQIEIDSVDFMRFVLELERRLGVRVLEQDYPRLASLAGAAAYLEAMVDRRLR